MNDIDAPAFPQQMVFFWILMMSDGAKCGIFEK
jgi:hypothetical protein